MAIHPGNEPLLESGPPAFALSLLIGAALFYALPLAMISAELGTALPYDGGMVAWVNETCGRGVGLHNMYWLWVSFLFDSAAYPVLAASYASQKWVTGNEKALFYYSGPASESPAAVSALCRFAHAARCALPSARA